MRQKKIICMDYFQVVALVFSAMRAAKLGSQTWTLEGALSLWLLYADHRVQLMDKLKARFSLLIKEATEWQHRIIKEYITAGEQGHNLSVVELLDMPLVRRTTQELTVRLVLLWLALFRRKVEEKVRDDSGGNFNHRSVGFLSVAGAVAARGAGQFLEEHKELQHFSLERFVDFVQEKAAEQGTKGSSSAKYFNSEKVKAWQNTSRASMMQQMSYVANLARKQGTDAFQSWNSLHSSSPFKIIAKNVLGVDPEHFDDFLSELSGGVGFFDRNTEAPREILPDFLRATSAESGARPGLVPDSAEGASAELLVRLAFLDQYQVGGGGFAI